MGREVRQGKKDGRPRLRIDGKRRKRQTYPTQNVGAEAWPTPPERVKLSGRQSRKVGQGTPKLKRS